MKSISTPNIVELSHQLFAEVVSEGDLVIDATAGHGRDTAVLAKLVGSKGEVIAFDLQKEAIDSAKQHLEKLNLVNRVQFVHDCHSTIDRHLAEEVKPKLVVFNLGYLPRSNGQVRTRSESTLDCLRKVIPRILIGGRVVLVSYVSHEGGQVEFDDLGTYCRGLSPTFFTTMLLQQPNRPHSPRIFCIDKSK